MASSKQYLEFILEQLSEFGDITYRPMMGEYIIYIFLFKTLKTIIKKSFTHLFRQMTFYI